MTDKDNPNSRERAFREERKTGLGGSDIGDMYSLGYGCARELQYEKRGVVPDFPREETSAMERGKLLEPVAIEVYRGRTGRRAVQDGELYRHDDYHWMLVHPDGMILDPKKPGAGVLEIKVLGWHSFARQKREGLEESYILQLQHSMAVTGCQWGSFGILCLEPWQFLWFDVDQDEALIARLIEDEAIFWGKVKNGPWIEKLDPKDFRCGKCPYRRTCQGEALIQAFIKDDGADLPRDDSLAEKLRAIEELDQLKDEATELLDAAKVELKKLLGDRPGAIMPGYRVYFREYKEERWETAAMTARFKKDAMFKNLMEQYRKTGVKRPLRYYPTGD